MAGEKARRGRGEGSVFRMPGSVYWWIGYAANGKRVRESAHTESRGAALKMLRERLHTVTAGTYTGRDAERLTFDTIAEGLRTKYRLDGLRSLVRANRALGHLRAHFAGWLVKNITRAAVADYHAARLEAGAAQASVHYEIAILKRAFSVARENGQHTARLEYKLGEVDNARHGFFDRADFEAVRNELPEALRSLVTFAYLTGWRKQEMLDLQWRNVDVAAGMIRLEPGTTKNGEGRAFPFGPLPELAELLRAQRAATSATERERGAVIPFVFHRDGAPIRSYDVAWRAACTRAGVAGRIVHDFRRTAVRNLVRAGVPRSIAMKMTGHKTEAVFERYNITDEADLNVAATKLAALHESHVRDVLPLRATGTN